MILRPYQQSALDSVWGALRMRDDNPCVVLPTGSGKTPLMATLCREAVMQWGGRVLILAHVKELLEQTAGTLHRLAPEVEFGVYSAGLKRRDTDHVVIIAGIQSVYERACELGAFDLIFIDEAHLIPKAGEGRYLTFLAKAKVVNPDVRVIGLTATPYRMSSGAICEPGNILNHVCHETGIKELIQAGYLCGLTSKAPKVAIKSDGFHIRNGEFVASEVAERFDSGLAMTPIVDDIISRTQDRHGILVFASSVINAEILKGHLQDATREEVGLITGETKTWERDELTARFRGASTPLNPRPPLRWLVNVNVLTTGFDAPNVDCVCLVRPTASAGLYYQMVGRGFRICETKTNCLVLDYGENIKRHGAIDCITVKTASGEVKPAPMKVCPECEAIMSARVSVCPDCGFEFPLKTKDEEEKEPKLQDSAANDSILSGEKTETEYNVLDVSYYAAPSKKDPSVKTVRVEYQVGMMTVIRSWVCPEHEGWVRDNRFIPWWRKRSKLPVPRSADDVAEYGNKKMLATPQRIKVTETSGDKYPEVVELDFTELPVPVALVKVDPDFVCHNCTAYPCERDTFGDNVACERFAKREASVWDDCPF